MRYFQPLLIAVTLALTGCASSVKYDENSRCDSKRQSSVIGDAYGIALACKNKFPDLSNSVDAQIQTLERKAPSCMAYWKSSKKEPVLSLGVQLIEGHIKEGAAGRKSCTKTVLCAHL